MYTPNGWMYILRQQRLQALQLGNWVVPLRNVFLDQCVMNNATCFASSDFEEFMTNIGIKHIIAPYHPAANGQAEQAVQSFKDSLKKIKERDIETRVCKIPLQYFTTPYTTTGLSPAELLMKRKLTTWLSRVRSNLQLRMNEKQMVAKENHDQHVKQTEFIEGDLVFVCIFKSRKKWILKVVNKRSGYVSGHVRVLNGQIFRRQPKNPFPFMKNLSFV